MTPSRYDRAKALVLEALERPAGERNAFVRARCADDAGLLAYVLSLLAQSDTASPVLDASAVERIAIDWIDGDDDAHRLPPGVGPYEIGERLGEGGMGVVHRAHQRTPVEREVAIKILRRGMDSARVLARFEGERRTLARLDHPHVAQILDAGSLEDGRPFVVMPLIEGTSITRYCDEHRLDLRRRLELFLLVCRAVEHAHGRGILHRDLKPQNILVRQIDGEASPTVIDFGIAKALRPDTTEFGDLTLEGQRIGTPAYMSPEQLQLLPEDIDVRSDVYALGVILYELMVGRHPFGNRLEEITRALARGEQPSRTMEPSTALEAEDAAERAHARATTPTRWRRQLRGDLDIICRTALHFEPARRYASAAHLADDLQNFLQRRPIRARPDSFRYRLGKSMRRHPARSTAAAALLLLLLATPVLLLLHGHTVSRQRDRALAAEARATAQARISGEIAGFLEGLFTEADPTQGNAADLSARELLDQGASRIRRTLTDAPEVRGQLLTVLGKVHTVLGLHDQADTLLSLALNDFARMPSGATRDSLRAEAALELGTSLHDLGRYAESESLYALSASLRRSLAGEADLDHAIALSYQGVSAQARGDYDRATDLLQHALDLHLDRGGPDDPEVGWVRGLLGYLHYKRGDYQRCMALFEQALRAARDAPVPSPIDLGHALNNLAGMNLELDHVERADSLASEALQVYQSLYPEGHPAVARALIALGNVRLRRGRLDEARDLFDRGLLMNTELLGPEHRNTSKARAAGVRLEAALGHYDRALSGIRALCAERARLYGPHDALTLDARQREMEYLQRLGHSAELLASSEDLLVALAEMHGEKHPAVCALRVLRAQAMLTLGQLEAARAEMDSVPTRLMRAFGEGHPKVTEARRLQMRLRG